MTEKRFHAINADAFSWVKWCLNITWNESTTGKYKFILPMYVQGVIVLVFWSVRERNYWVSGCPGHPKTLPETQGFPKDSPLSFVKPERGGFLKGNRIIFRNFALWSVAVCVFVCLSVCLCSAGWTAEYTDLKFGAHIKDIHICNICPKGGRVSCAKSIP